MDSVNYFLYDVQTKRCSERSGEFPKGVVCSEANRLFVQDEIDGLHPTVLEPIFMYLVVNNTSLLGVITAKIPVAPEGIEDCIAQALTALMPARIASSIVFGSDIELWCCTVGE